MEPQDDYKNFWEKTSAKISEILMQNSIAQGNADTPQSFYYLKLLDPDKERLQTILRLLESGFCKGDPATEAGYQEEINRVQREITKIKRLTSQENTQRNKYLQALSESKRLLNNIQFLIETNKGITEQMIRDARELSTQIKKLEKVLELFLYSLEEEKDPQIKDFYQGEVNEIESILEGETAIMQALEEKNKVSNPQTPIDSSDVNDTEYCNNS